MFYLEHTTFLTHINALKEDFQFSKSRSMYKQVGAGGGHSLYKLQCPEGLHQVMPPSSGMGILGLPIDSQLSYPVFQFFKPCCCITRQPASLSSQVFTRCALAAHCSRGAVLLNGAEGFRTRACVGPHGRVAGARPTLYARGCEGDAGEAAEARSYHSVNLFWMTRG